MAPDSLSLEGKVALITGSGREPGLGAGIAETLARNGASIILNFVSDSTAPRAQALATRLRTQYGVSVGLVQASIDSQEGADRLVADGLRAVASQRVDILVNNAGCSVVGSTLDMSLEDMHRQFAVNVFGATYMVRAAVPRMPRGGRIINVGSVASKISLWSTPFYNASKAAQDSLTFTWAAEFGRSHQITVNSVAPGPIATDMQREFASQNPAGQRAIQDLVDRTRAADRLGEIEDLADAVLLLVQEKSRWITGQHISLSGGITGG